MWSATSMCFCAWYATHPCTSTETLILCTQVRELCFIIDIHHCTHAVRWKILYNTTHYTMCWNNFDWLQPGYIGGIFHMGVQCWCYSMATITAKLLSVYRYCSCSAIKWYPHAHRICNIRSTEQRCVTVCTFTDGILRKSWLGIMNLATFSITSWWKWWTLHTPHK